VKDVGTGLHARLDAARVNELATESESMRAEAMRASEAMWATVSASLSRTRAARRRMVFATKAASTPRIAAVLHTLGHMGVGDHERVVVVLADAASAGVAPSLAEVRAALRVGDPDTLDDLAQTIVDAWVWALAAHEPAEFIRALGAWLARADHELTATTAPDGYRWPPRVAPHRDVHVLAAPAPANAPPHCDLPTIREVAA
jgi:hypothetical protein